MLKDHVISKQHMGRNVEGSGSWPNHYLLGVAEENDRKYESVSLVCRWCHWIFPL